MKVYNLYLIYSGAVLYLQQDSVDMGNGNTYVRGEIVTKDATNTGLLDNPSVDIDFAANLVDTNGDEVAVQFSEDSRIEIKQISTYTSATKTVEVTGGFSSNAPEDTIWAISLADANSTDLEKYRILSISEENSGEYSISASRYAPTKFDEIELQTTDRHGD